MHIKLLKLIVEMFETKLDIMTKQLELLKQQQGRNEYYIVAGKTIEDISDRYPSTYEDAAIIFEEWSKGVLSTHRPYDSQLREFAQFTASDEVWWMWINKKYRKETK
jgi:hypothetical protein